MKALLFRPQFLIIIFFTTISVYVSAQIPSYEKWYNGEVYLKDSSAYQGELKYDFRDELVYFRKDTLHLIFHASFIKDFKIYKNSGICNSFVALAYKGKQKKKRFMLFQVVYPARNSEVLARENYLVNSMYTNIPLAGSGTHKVSEDFDYFRNRTKIKIENIYFIQSPDGTINEVRLTRRKVLKAFPDKRDLLKNYISSNKLYFKKFGDLIKVVEYYDGLAGKPGF
jgi:hypothetical protein